MTTEVEELRSKAKPGYMGDAAAKLLCHVKFIERLDLPRGESNRYKPGSLSANVACRTVGLSYAEIERRLRERFPESEVTNNTLRWYAAKIADPSYSRFSGMCLPQRRPQRMKGRWV
jgi:hypothetical protein